jgi:hypothetical protein
MAIILSAWQFSRLPVPAGADILRKSAHRAAEGVHGFAARHLNRETVVKSWCLERKQLGWMASGRSRVNSVFLGQAYDRLTPTSLYP